MSYPKLLAPLFVSCCLLTSAFYAGVHLGLPGKQQPQSFNDLMVLASPVDKDNSLLIFDYLMKYADSEKLTVIMATHNDELANKCNKEIKLV